MTKTKRKRWRPRRWVSPAPNGIGHQKPNHAADILRTVWENRRHPLYAWRVLAKGSCDGCALGVTGFHDWTIKGIHLCTTRLKLLQLNTADALDPAALSDARALARHDGKELRALGRLGTPMRRRHGEPGFTPVPWDEALDRLAGAVATAGGDRTAVYITSRGITNEVYYAAGKAARALGVANVDSAARICHAPSTLALKETIGAAATTCSFADVLEADLVVLVGSNPANNQPVFMKYLYEATRQGAKVAVVNPYLEPGLERYWVPSSPESALFGTKICDLHVPVRPGGDVAFANAVLQGLIERGAVDRTFIDEHTEGFDDFAADLARQPRSDLLAAAGLDEKTVEAFTDLYAAADRAVIVWSMGITQHRDAADSVRALVNLGLARGNVGRDGAGLMPIRGHSGVQGGAEMGAYATALPGGAQVEPDSAAELGRKWGFPIPDQPGLTAPEMVDAAEQGRLDILWSSGGNFLEVLPDPPRVDRALRQVALRVHQDVIVSPSMLVDPAPGGEVLLLPAATRYEQEGGGTETTTERRIIYSPEIPGHQVGEARSEWRLFADVVPLYAGIERLRESGDEVQYGGRHLAPGGRFPTPSRRGRFTPVRPPDTDLPPGRFFVSTRRGKQFNSMVQETVDPLNGAARDDVLMDASDAEELGLVEGDAIVLRSAAGSYRGRVRLARLATRSLQVHWPEGNVLIESGPEHREPGSKTPDYNAVVTVEKAGTPVTIGT